MTVKERLQKHLAARERELAELHGKAVANRADVARLEAERQAVAKGYALAQKTEADITRAVGALTAAQSRAEGLALAIADATQAVEAARAELQPILDAEAREVAAREREAATTAARDAAEGVRRAVLGLAEAQAAFALRLARLAALDRGEASAVNASLAWSNEPVVQLEAQGWRPVVALGFEAAMFPRSVPAMLAPDPRLPHGGRLDAFEVWPLVRT